jgi:hypothetical protein
MAAGARPIAVERVLLAVVASPLTGASPVAVRAWTAGAGAVGMSASTRPAAATGSASRVRAAGTGGCMISSRGAPVVAGRVPGRRVAASSSGSGVESESGAERGLAPSRPCSGGCVAAAERLQAVSSVALSSTITEGRRGWCTSERAGFVMAVNKGSRRGGSAAGGGGV